MNRPLRILLLASCAFGLAACEPVEEGAPDPVPPEEPSLDNAATTSSSVPVVSPDTVAP